MFWTRRLADRSHTTKTPAISWPNASSLQSLDPGRKDACCPCERPHGDFPMQRRHKTGVAVQDNAEHQVVNAGSAHDASTLIWCQTTCSSYQTCTRTHEHALFCACEVHFSCRQLLNNHSTGCLEQATNMSHLTQGDEALSR